jgi:hypothetical protein
MPQDELSGPDLGGVVGEDLANIELSNRAVGGPPLQPAP